MWERGVTEFSKGNEEGLCPRVVCREGLLNLFRELLDIHAEAHYTNMEKDLTKCRPSRMESNCADHLFHSL